MEEINLKNLEALRNSVEAGPKTKFMARVFGKKVIRYSSVLSAYLKISKYRGYEYFIKEVECTH